MAELLSLSAMPRARPNLSGQPVLLLSPPWRKWNWPSMALGCLKAYLEREGISVQAEHVHLRFAVELGLERYEQVADDWGVGDALFSALLAPAEAERLLAPYVESNRRRGAVALADWLSSTACADVAAVLERWLEQAHIRSYPWVGFSIGAMQLAASMYLATRVRALHPGAVIVIGGSGLVAPVAERVMRAWPVVDFAVNGEGELALLGLVRHRKASDIRALPGVLYRCARGDVHRSTGGSGVDLETLPVPDYAEYFRSLDEIGCPSSSVVLPIEHSRGCHWEHKRKDGELSGCTFCGLYRNSPDFRRKPVEQTLRDARQVSKASQLLNLAFVDAYLPRSYRRDLLNALVQERSDFTLFTEMRCDFDEEVASLLTRAGTFRVQLGVEAFSSAVLRKLDKGVSCFDNVYAMRLCEEYGVPYQYNLMLRIPGISVEEVAQQLAILPCLFGFRPPHAIDFYLDRGSRMYRSPEQYGIEPASLDCEPTAFLPSELADRKLCLAVPFRALTGFAGEQDWARLEAAVEVWSQAYERTRAMGAEQGLYYRDGGDFLIVTDLRGESLKHIRLFGLAREVFLACRRPTRRRDLFATRDEAQVGDVLAYLIDQHLVLHVDDRLLTLPPRVRKPSGVPSAWT